MKFSHVTAAFLVCWSASSAYADEDLYKAVCANCHSKSFVNSPQVGDKAKWAPLISEGQVILTAHGYVGVRAMPAKGGKPDLSIEKFSEAVVYMVNKSGGNWKTPDAKTLAAINAEIVRRQKSMSK
jgi:cytochrome c5